MQDAGCKRKAAGFSEPVGWIRLQAVIRRFAEADCVFCDPMSQGATLFRPAIFSRYSP
jgi:hypothetical protein